MRLFLFYTNNGMFNFCLKYLIFKMKISKLALS